jgi:zinc D-Ala-D-Ala carboxypeptidase
MMAERFLTPNFALAELTASQAAARAGISNTPAAAHLANLERLAGQLELVREALGGRPMLISSGYRSPKVNALVGGSASSAHTKGLAADFTCPAFGPPREGSSMRISPSIS